LIINGGRNRVQEEKLGGKYDIVDATKSTSSKLVHMAGDGLTSREK
jgi:hypothetical protein